MSEIKRIFKNTMFLFFSNAINVGLSLILVVAIARYLGNEGFGKYSFAFAFAGLLSMFADLGLSGFVIREISKNKKMAESYINNLAGQKLVLGILSVIVPVIIIILTSKSPEVVLVVTLASIATFFIRYNSTYVVLFRSYEVMEFESISSVVERLVALVLGLIVLMKGYGVVALASVLVVSNFADFLFSHFSARKKVFHVKPRFEKDFWKFDFLMKNGLPFWFTGVFINIYFRIDTIMLGYMTSYAVVGWYNAAYQIIDMLGKIPFIVTSALFPVMSRFFVSSKDMLKKVFHKSIYYLFILAVPIGIGGALLADRLIIFVFKSQFRESVVALQILIWALVFMFVNYLIGYLLNSIEKQKIFTLTTGACALFNIILNIILIPKYSYKGSAFATVLTEALNFSLLYYFAAKSGYKLDIFAICLKPITAGIAMAGFLVYFRWFHLLILVPLAGLFYFFILWVIKGFSKEEYEILRIIFSKNKT